MNEQKIIATESNTRAALCSSQSKDDLLYMFVCVSVCATWTDLHIIFFLFFIPRCFCFLHFSLFSFPPVSYKIIANAGQQQEIRNGEKQQQQQQNVTFVGR